MHHAPPCLRMVEGHGDMFNASTPALTAPAKHPGTVPTACMALRRQNHLTPFKYSYSPVETGHDGTMYAGQVLPPS